MNRSHHSGSACHAFHPRVHSHRDDPLRNPGSFFITYVFQAHKWQEAFTPQETSRRNEVARMYPAELMHMCPCRNLLEHGSCRYEDCRHIHFLKDHFPLCTGYLQPYGRAPYTADWRRMNRLWSNYIQRL